MIGADWRLLHGDCLDLLPTLEEESIDALITDPPYSSGGQFRGDRLARPSTKYQNTDSKREYFEFVGDNRDQRSYLAWCVLWLSACRRVLRAGAPIALFTDWRQLPTMTDAIQAAGFIWRGVAVWDKTGAARPSMGRFAAQCEYVVWGSLGPMPVDRGVGCLPGLFRHYQPPAERVHMTEKPVPVMRQVNALCRSGGVILDPFVGAGSTGVAAIEAGYGFIGMEMTREYFRYAEGRLQSALPSLAAERTLFDPLEVTS